MDSTKRRKTQPRDAIVSLNSYQFPAVNLHSDAENHVARDLDSMSVLFSLIFPSPVQKFVEERLKFHSCRIFSPIDPPSLNEMDAIIPLMLSAYTDAQAMYAPILTHRLYIKEVPCKTTTCSIHDAYLVDCVLARTYKKARPIHNSTFAETVVLTRSSKELCLSRNDNLFRTLVVIIPLAGVFYTKTRKICTPTIEGQPQFQITPLPSSWLRLHLKTGIPAAGSFIKRFNRIWSIDFSDNSQCSFQRCVQFSENIQNTPTLRANTMAPGAANTYPVDSKTSYQPQQLTKSISAFRNDSQETCYHYDPLVQGECVFYVTVMDDDGLPECHSVVKVSNALHYPDFMSSLVDGSNLFISTTGVRRNNRYQFGVHGGWNGDCILSDSSTSGLLDNNLESFFSDFYLYLPLICRNAVQFANQTFPGVLSLIDHLDTMADIKRPSLFGGNDGVSSSMAISFDHANSSHTDTTDGSVGFFVASETSPGLDPVVGWNFVLPNVSLNVDGDEYEGLTIRLSHGCSVLWDGRIIRHGTSCHTSNPNNHTMGWFWSLSATTYASAMFTVSL
jgi:hypothetical protein